MIIRRDRIWGIPSRTALTLNAIMTAVMLVGWWVSLGTAPFVAAFLLSVLPVPAYVSLALWLDRYEFEPVRLLAKAFGWGAIVATFFAGYINDWAAVFTGSELIAAVVSAPIAEETLKAIALLLLFWQQRHEFDNVTDGVVYATMVGLGFAMTENVYYYGASVLYGEALPTFINRGVVAPYAHPLFTAMTGIGFGIAMEWRRMHPMRLLAPILGLAAAIGLHALWNLSASVGGFSGVYLFIMVPCFAGVLLMVRRSVRREQAIMRKHLLPYVEGGLLSSHQLELACTAKATLRDAWSVAWGGMARRDPERRRLHQAAAELAFHRWRMDRGIAPRREVAGDWERVYQSRLRSVTRGQEAQPASRSWSVTAHSG